MRLPIHKFIEPEQALQGGTLWPKLGLIDGKAVHGLYLHVPFCFHRCHYCDFFSVVDQPEGDRDRQAEFAAALLRELDDRCLRLAPQPDSIFVGGGTPTLLKPALWEDLLARLHSLGVMSSVREFTVEANPETVTEELAGTLSAGGVTRVSIGAQSFNPAHLKTLERWHDPENVARSVQRFRAAGIGRINLDLIFGIPGQTLDDFADDLDAAVSLGVEHVSCYALTYEPNTAMTSRLNKGMIAPCPEDLESRMYELAIERLAEAGFEHYEISAWATPSEQSLHNLHYWRNDFYLGVGPAAASHLNGHRWKNKPHLEQYISHSPEHPIADHEYLDATGRAGEVLMMGLRLREGVDTAWLHEHFTARCEELARFTDQGLIESVDGRTRLTRRGLLVADGVIAQLI